MFYHLCEYIYQYEYYIYTMSIQIFYSLSETMTLNCLLCGWLRGQTQLRVVFSSTFVIKTLPLGRRRVVASLLTSMTGVSPLTDSVVLGEHSRMAEPPFCTVRDTVSAPEGVEYALSIHPLNSAVHRAVAHNAYHNCGFMGKIGSKWTVP